jgi:hypothetical protein
MFGGLFVFLEFLTPLLLGGCNFLISNPFSTIVIVSDAPGGAVQVLFGHQKQRSPRIPTPQEFMKKQTSKAEAGTKKKNLMRRRR